MKKIIIPVLFCLIAHIGFAQKATNMSTIKVGPNGTIHYSQMDNAPLFAGCENAGTTKQQNKCTENKVQAYLQKSFDKNTAKSISAKRNIVDNNVYVRFIVNKQGAIENIGVRVSNEQMKAEIKRIVATLPRFSKGTHQGKAVNTSFSYWFQADLLLRNAAE
ncbi:energy transducer TonB [Kordia sp.]|uniref:energy transducer TonB n=1 Tax=Kordia sp. TaxID=1965332 RepID=UPI003D2E28BC